MATASVTNTFVAGTTANPSTVNQNFTDLLTFLNNSVVHVDGSKAMTAALTLNTESSANHATRKTYVDAATLLRVLTDQTSANSNTVAGGTWTPTTQQLRIITGSVVGTFSSGHLTVVFPDTGFPTGCIAVIPSMGDGGSGGEPLFVSLVEASASKLQFECVAANANGVGLSGSGRVNYVAFGW